MSFLLRAKDAVGEARAGLSGWPERMRWRRALRDRDVPLLMKASKVLFPADQQPADEREATAMMHIVRTRSEWLELEHRAYSHFWCEDHGFPSLLPPTLLLEAEGFRPTIKSSVGIACGTARGWLKPAIEHMGLAMAKAVQDNAELIETDPELLKDKMFFAKNDEFRRLFGVATPMEVER